MFRADAEFDLGIYSPSRGINYRRFQIYWARA
jgi:hypothetical protein